MTDSLGTGSLLEGEERMRLAALFSSRLKLIQKLLLVTALFLAPIGLLTQLFVAQSLKDIDFAAKEVEGVAYLKSLWPMFSGASRPEAMASLVESEGKTLAQTAAKLN